MLRSILLVGLYLYLLFFVRQVVEVVSCRLLGIRVQKIRYTGIIPRMYKKSVVAGVPIEFGGILFPSVWVKHSDWSETGLFGRRGIVIVLKLLATAGLTLFLFGTVTDADVFEVLKNRELLTVFSQFANVYARENFPFSFRLLVSMTAFYLALLPILVVWDLTSLLEIILWLVLDLRGKKSTEKNSDNDEEVYYFQLRINIYVLVAFLLLLLSVMVFFVLR